MLENIKEEVSKLLNGDTSGHGMDHINRVLELSLKFSEKENANKNVVILISLLHDVDDYKLFGEENAKNLVNANIIMDKIKIDDQTKQQVLQSLKCIGYSNLLKGLRPQTIEGKIVSDADMCDALGVNGILRVYTYSMKNQKPFFDKNIFPIENISTNTYTGKCADSSVCHIFEKILKLKDLMMTDSGKKEALDRHQIIIELLYHLFAEENAPEWTLYLDEYLENQKATNQKSLNKIGGNL